MRIDFDMKYTCFIYINQILYCIFEDSNDSADGNKYIYLLAVDILLSSNKFRV